MKKLLMIAFAAVSLVACTDYLDEFQEEYNESFVAIDTPSDDDGKLSSAGTHGSSSAAPTDTKPASSSSENAGSSADEPVSSESNPSSSESEPTSSNDDGSLCTSEGAALLYDYKNDSFKNSFVLESVGDWLYLKFKSSPQSLFSVKELGQVCVEYESLTKFDFYVWNSSDGDYCMAKPSLSKEKNASIVEFDCPEKFVNAFAYQKSSDVTVHKVYIYGRIDLYSPSSESSSSAKSSSSVQSSSSTKSSSSQSLPEGLTSVASCTGDTLYNKNSNDDEFLFGDSYWWSGDGDYKYFIFGPADYDISSWDHFCVTYVAKDSVGLTLVNAASNYQEYKTAPKLPSGNHSIEVALNAFTGGDLNAFESLTFSASNPWTEALEIKTITVKKDTRDIFPYFDDVAEKTDDLTPVYYVGQTLNVDNTEFYAVSLGGGADSSNKGKIMKVYTGNCISDTCYVEFGLNTIKGSALYDWGGVCFEIASTGNYDVEVYRNSDVDQNETDPVRLGIVAGNKTPTAQLHCHNWNSFKNGSSKMALSSDDYMHAIRIVFKDKKQSVYIRNVYKYEETCKVADVGECNTVSN